MTDCTKPTRVVEGFAKPVRVAFDAPHSSSDGGALLLRRAEDRVGACQALAAVVPDVRDQAHVRHSRQEQVTQRVLQIALGYEDCNDAATLRHDPALVLACTGDAGPRPLSSQPTLSRLENAVDGRCLAHAVRWFEQSWVDALPPDTDEVLLDIDATDDPTHGAQQLSMFHGFYDQHMYHPLLVFDGRTGQLVTGLLRPGTVHASRGAAPVLARVIRKLKARFPAVRVIVRGDSAFAMPALMDRLDVLNAQLGDVEFVLGVARNAVLERTLADELAAARADHEQQGRTVQRFSAHWYAAGTWLAERRVVAKAEHGQKGSNPRFVVTTLHEDSPEDVYRFYCERGDAENRIKDLKNALKADRLSCSRFAANFFRLLLHMAAYRLMFAVRLAAAEVSAELGRAQFDTLRLRLLKVAALVSRSVRRVLVRLPESFPFADVFAAVLHALRPRPAPA